MDETQALFADDDSSSVNVKELLVFGLARSRYLVLFLVLLGAAGGVLVAAMEPNTYSSTAKLILRVGQREKMNAEVGTGLVDVQGGSSRSTVHMSDEMHLLNDPAIYERVAREIGTEEVLDVADPRAADNEETALHTKLFHALQARFLGLPEVLAKDEETSREEAGTKRVQLAGRALYARTLVSTDRDSSVITVTHAANSPERARNVTQALAQAFVDRHKEQFSVQRHVDQLRDGLRTVTRRLEGIQGRYEDHTGSCGFFDVHSQKPVLMADIESLDTQLYSSELEREGAVLELAAIDTRLRTHEEYRAALVTQKGDVGSLQVPVQERINLEKEYDLKIDGVDEEVRRLELESERLRVKKETLDSRSESLKSRLEKQYLELSRLRSCESVHDGMESHIEEERSRYTHLVDRLARYEALAGLDESNLQVLLPARIEPEKIGPKRKRLLMFGLLAGASLGMVLAVARQLLDKRLRYPTTMERELGVPMLAAVPEIKP